MILNKNKSQQLLEELNTRHATLHEVLAGRQADERDRRYCPKGSWTKEILDICVAVDS